MGRDQTIDVMKALCIIGVVLLHAIFIHYGENTEASNILRLVCVNGFFVLSGYVIYGKAENGKWITTKIISRIPMLTIFTFLFWLFNNYVVGVDGAKVLNISAGNYYLYNIATGFILSVLWYIWVITIGCLVIYGFEKYIRPIKISNAIKYAAFIGVIFIPLDASGLNLLKWYGLFMFAGYILGQYKLKAWMLYFSASLFLIFIIVFYGLITYSGEAVNGGYADVMGVTKSGEWIYLGAYIALSVTGISFLYCVSSIINKLRAGKPFLIIGGATIGVLLFHKPLLELNLLYNYWLSAIIAFVLSFGLYQLLRRVRILNYLLFGGTDIPIKISNKLGGWYAKTQTTEG